MERKEVKKALLEILDWVHLDNENS